MPSRRRFSFVSLLLVLAAMTTASIASARSPARRWRPKRSLVRVEVVDAIGAGTAALTPQVEEGASHQGLVDDEVARIDLGWDLAKVEQRIRGCDPSPGAWLEHDGQPVRLFGSSVESRSQTGDAPGTVLAVGDDGLVLAVRGGSIRIQKVRGAAGKVTAAESGLAAGDVLG